VKNDNFNTFAQETFQKALYDKNFSDVTLVSSDDELIPAHKLILSGSSSFFGNLLSKHNHPNPLIFLKGVPAKIMMSILTFMYHGQAQIEQKDLETFLDCCKDLQIRGATDEVPGARKENLYEVKTENLETVETAVKTGDESLAEQVEMQNNLETFGDSLSESILPLQENPYQEVPETREEADESAALTETKEESDELTETKYNETKEQTNFSYKKPVSAYHTPKNPKPANLCCKLCDYRVHRNDLLKLHMNSKHNAEKFTCRVPACGRNYSSKINLRHHMKSNHDCASCGQELPNGSELKLHKKLNHGVSA